MGLKISVSTLIGMEWNALTYAGHTVWNVHAERDGGGYVGGHKRRPRDDWHICRDTHKALISEEEAEALIEALENSNISKAISQAKAAGSPYLLTPLLETPDGRQWTGDRRRYYRLKNKRGERSSSVPLEPLQGAVLNQIMADTSPPEFVHELAAEARRVAQTDDPAKPLRRQFEKLEQKALTEEIQSLDKESAVRNALANITDEQVATFLKDAVEPKALLNTVVSRITLDPGTHECQIHYQLPMWLSMASPRGFEPLLPP
jgi:site-specific DNA recombinase